MVNAAETSVDKLLAKLQGAGLTQAHLDNDGDIFVPPGIGGSEQDLGAWVYIIGGEMARFYTFVECSQAVDTDTLLAHVTRLKLRKTL